MAEKSFIMFLLITASVFWACESDYTPKPKGYPRIDLPEKEYQSFEEDCPFTFKYHVKSVIFPVKEKKQLCWFNIDYPDLQCRIHLSYVPVNDNLHELLEDSRTLVYKHTIKASAINEKEIADESKRLYARIYEIDGDAASNVQFYATDSLNHFLRGALYFNAAPNADSLAPSIEYLREDISHMVESINWK